MRTILFDSTNKIAFIHVKDKKKQNKAKPEQISYSIAFNVSCLNIKGCILSFQYYH